MTGAGLSAVVADDGQAVTLCHQPAGGPAVPLTTRPVLNLQTTSPKQPWFSVPVTLAVAPGGAASTP